MFCLKTPSKAQAWMLQNGWLQKTQPCPGTPLGAVTLQFMMGKFGFQATDQLTPWVRTLNNPFPATGDFKVELDLTYTVIADSGNGIRIFSNPQVNNEYNWSNNIFTLWAHDEGETTGVILIELFNKVVYKDYVAGFKTRLAASQFTSWEYA